MNVLLEKYLEILERTPDVLAALLGSLSDDWTTAREGPDTWTAREVVAHLIVCEETDWLPRARIILSQSADKILAPIDMSAHFAIAANTALPRLLLRFRDLRIDGVAELTGYRLQPEDLLKKATHPVLGEVSLQELIVTWATHDLSHIAQIARILARQHKDLTGHFKHYLKILH